MVNCNWWSIKWNIKNVIEDLYSSTMSITFDTFSTCDWSVFELSQVMNIGGFGLLLYPSGQPRGQWLEVVVAPKLVACESESGL